MVFCHSFNRAKPADRRIECLLPLINETMGEQAVTIPETKIQSRSFITIWNIYISELKIHSP